MNSGLNSNLLLALSLFAVVSSITPGPNNTMILASGVRFGLRRSLPHLAGISLGFGFMLVVVGLGLHAVLHDYPIVLDILRYVGSAYLLWLAYQLATAPPPSAATTDTARPMGFWTAAAFQWVNIPCVGVWAGCGSAMRSYLQDPVLSRIFNITMALALVASLYPMLTG